MKVKIKITYEMEDELNLEERQAEDPEATIEDIKNNQCEWICDELYGRMETRAGNVLLSGYQSDCIIEFEDGTRSSYLTG